MVARGASIKKDAQITQSSFFILLMFISTETYAILSLQTCMVRERDPN
jgi:hypothetical protein